MTFISNKLYTEAMKEELVTADSMKEVTNLHSPSASLQEWLPDSLHLLPSTTAHTLSSSAVYEKESGGAGSCDSHYQCPFLDSTVASFSVGRLLNDEKGIHA